MGGALIGLHNFNAAREALEDAASRFERVGAHRGRARARLMLARIALRERRLEDADALLLAARRDDEPPVDRILREQAVASLDAARGDHDAALERIASAMHAAQALGHAPLLADLLHARATSLAALDDRAGAIEALRDAVDQIERVRGTLQGDLLRVAFLSTRREVFDDKVRLALDLGGDDGAALAFEIAERSRSRTLLDLMQHGVELAEHFTSLASDEERPLVEGLVRSRQEMNALYVSLDKGKLTDPVRWSARVAEVEAHISKFEQRLAFTRRFSALAGRTRTLEEVQRALPEDAAFVQWFDDADRVGCFVVRRGASIFLSLAPTREVRLASELLRLQIARALRRPAIVAGDSGPACSALRTLYDMLVAPILPHCPGATTIVFAPSATLHGVPFHSLTDEDGCFLIESMRVACITSASVMLECMDAKREPGSSGRSLVVAHGDDRAPEVAGEAIEIARTLGETTLLAGEDARFDAIEREAPSLSLLHISGHGVFDESAPMSAGLRLADRWMSARDVFRLRLNACDVVLGCCDAGRGATLRGDELLGLSRAFLAAGARCVLAPLWPLEDAAARRLLTRTYRLWLDSDRSSILDAITVAQREAIAEGVHPCLWASFQFVGAP
jgi:CHAT domain-containing protein